MIERERGSVALGHAFPRNDAPLVSSCDRRSPDVRPCRVWRPRPDRCRDCGTAGASGAGGARYRLTARRRRRSADVGGAVGDLGQAFGQPQHLDTGPARPYGDPYGLRSFLKTKGIEYSLTYIGESFGNAKGGVRRGAIVEGRLDIQFDADLEKLADWQGATFHTNLYLIHGTGLSRYYVNNFITVSAIEALPSSRLYEIWLEQKLFDGQFGLKVGQIAADTEFAVTQTGTLFINSTFGWPNIMAEVLPSGGPIYPLAVPAIRAKYVPNQNFSLQVGVFDGDPAGPYPSDLDPQRRNRTGTNFRTSDPALVIAEAAYAYNIAQGDEGDPGTVTLGGWHHFGRFDSQRFDEAGRSLADPSTTRHRPALSRR